ncbi:hypothetical protein [Streptomyces sp. NPDC020742]|uniref:hypothetical protein n=1 Tax=unclassified Streptomyces TaxID=2593676 RepID=UPI0033C31440
MQHAETPEEPRRRSPAPSAAGPPTPPAHHGDPQAPDRDPDRGGAGHPPMKLTEMARRKAKQAMEKLKPHGAHESDGPHDR